MTDPNINDIIRRSARNKSQSLELIEKGIIEIPVQLYDLKNLIKLDLSRNQIVIVDKSIEKLIFLNYLNLSYNRILELPLEMTNLSNLETLIISNNPISEHIKDFNPLWRNSLKEMIDTKKSEEENRLRIANLQKPTLTSKAKVLDKLNNASVTVGMKFKMAIHSKIDKPATDNAISANEKVFRPNTAIKLTSLGKSGEVQSNSKQQQISQIHKKESHNDSYGFDEVNDIPDKEDDNLGIADEAYSKLKSELEQYKERLNLIEKENLDLNSKLAFKEEELSNAKKQSGVNLNTLSPNVTIQQTDESRARTAKRNCNWMDEGKSTKTNFFNAEAKTDDSSSNLIAEQQNTKRLKAEVDRLNSIISDMGKHSQGSSTNSGVLEVNLSEITIAEKLGQGGFAIIHKGTWLYNEVAVKIIFDPKITDDLLDEFNNEIKMLSILRHPSIVSIIATCSKPKLAIVTEYAENGSLFDLLHQNK